MLIRDYNRRRKQGVLQSWDHSLFSSSGFRLLTGIRRPGRYRQPVGAFSPGPPRVRTSRAERCARHDVAAGSVQRCLSHNLRGTTLVVVVEAYDTRARNGRRFSNHNDICARRDVDIRPAPKRRNNKKKIDNNDGKRRRVRRGKEK